MQARDIGAGDVVRIDGWRGMVAVKGRPEGGRIRFKLEGKEVREPTMTFGAEEEVEVLTQWPHLPAGFSPVLQGSKSAV